MTQEGNSQTNLECGTNNPVLSFTNNIFKNAWWVCLSPKWNNGLGLPSYLTQLKMKKTEKKYMKQYF